MPHSLIRYGFAFLFCVSGMIVNAQPSRAVLSTKHVAKVEATENPVRKFKKYGRYFHRDSIRQVRNLKRYWRSQDDSITTAVQVRQEAIKEKSENIRDGVNSKIYNTVYKPWARNQADRSLKFLDENGIHISALSRQVLRNYLVGYFLTASQNDSLLASLKDRSPRLSLPKQLTSKLAGYKTLSAAGLQGKALSGIKGNPNLNQLTSWSGGAQELKNDFKKYGAYGKVLSNTDTLQGFAKSEGSRVAKEYLSKMDGAGQLGSIKKQLGESAKIATLPGGYKSQMEQLQDSTYIREQAKKKAEELASKYVSEHPEAIQGVQRKMSLLMRKYSAVPNSNDLSTAVKRTSLKGRTFLEHLQVAGNFQVISIKPVSIDFAPQIGYKINARFVAGLGGLYRKTFKDSIPSIAADVLGYNAFSSYEILGNFFITAEYGRNSPGTRVLEAGTKRIWENALFAGIGRKMLINPKIEMTLMAGYNFLHDQGDKVYARPWTIRVGFRSSELTFLNKKRMLAGGLK